MSNGLQQHSEGRSDFALFAATGDRAERDRLVEAHLGLAFHLARRFTNAGEPYDDLVQVASLALINAVNRFDPERGVEFSTFAARTIIGELKRHLRDKGWSVRAPRRLQELFLEVNRAVEELSQQLGRSPTVSDLAKACQISEVEVLEAIEAGQAYRSSSLDSVEPDGSTLASKLGEDDEHLATAEQRAALSPYLGKLPKRDQAILVMRFSEGLTQSEIAEKMGLSQMHVSRLLRISLASLRRAYSEDPQSDDKSNPERSNR